MFLCNNFCYRATKWRTPYSDQSVCQCLVKIVSASEHFYVLVNDIWHVGVLGQIKNRCGSGQLSKNIRVGSSENYFIFKKHFSSFPFVDDFLFLHTVYDNLHWNWWPKSLWQPLTTFLSDVYVNVVEAWKAKVYSKLQVSDNISAAIFFYKYVRIPIRNDYEQKSGNTGSGQIYYGRLLFFNFFLLFGWKKV